MAPSESGHAAILGMFRSPLRASWEDDVPRLGASLAYYTLFAIAPVLLVATAIAGLAFGAQAVRGEIVGQIDYLVGREGARAVQSDNPQRCLSEVLRIVTSSPFTKIPLSPQGFSPGKSSEAPLSSRPRSRTGNHGRAVP